MIELVFDTNILHQEGLTSGRMRLLKKLIDIEFVRLYIPELVKKEFISKRIASSTEAMLKSANNLKSISSNFELSAEFRTDLSALEDSIRSKIDFIEKTVLHDFDCWSRDLRVVELKFNPEDIHVVMSDYFSGHGVYRSIKSREDIPDAMINSCINRLAADLGNIFVIIKDGAFRRHLESNQSVVLFESLSDFLKAEAIEALKDKVDSVENVRNFLESDTANKSILNYFKEIEFNKGYIYIDEGGFLNKEVIADRVYGAEISTMINEKIKSLSVSNIYALSPKKYLITIEIQPALAIAVA